MDNYALAMQIVSDLISQGFIDDADEDDAVQVVYINLENDIL